MFSGSMVFIQVYPPTPSPRPLGLMKRRRQRRVGCRVVRNNVRVVAHEVDKQHNEERMHVHTRERLPNVLVVEVKPALSCDQHKENVHSHHQGKGLKWQCGKEFIHDSKYTRAKTAKHIARRIIWALSLWPWAQNNIDFL